MLLAGCRSVGNSNGSRKLLALGETAQQRCAITCSGAMRWRRSSAEADLSHLPRPTATPNPGQREYKGAWRMQFAEWKW